MIDHNKRLLEGMRLLVYLKWSTIFFSFRSNHSIDSNFVYTKTTLYISPLSCGVVIYGRWFKSMHTMCKCIDHWKSRNLKTIGLSAISNRHRKWVLSFNGHFLLSFLYFDKSFFSSFSIDSLSFAWTADFVPILCSNYYSIRHLSIIVRFQ